MSKSNTKTKDLHEGKSQNLRMFYVSLDTADTVIEGGPPCGVFVGWGMSAIRKNPALVAKTRLERGTRGSFLSGVYLRSASRISLRLAIKGVLALLGAEVVFTTGIVRMEVGLPFVDIHVANRIFRHCILLIGDSRFRC
jgi:hypothetical protein